ncbi:MAG: sulfatase family protein [Nocardioides sp.]
MSRSTARVAAGAVVVAVAALATLAGTSPDLGAPAAGTTATGMPAAERPRGMEVPEPAGRTPYERRLLDARRDTVTAESVVGGSDRPNILVLMTDDMRDDDLRFMPHVRELIADQGVRFTNTFSPQPLCCPARASFATGLYSHNHEVWSHVEPFGFRSLDDRRTLPVWLHEVGYDTSFLGKYLNGYGHQPTRTGGPSTRYVPPGWTDWRGSVDTVTEATDPDSDTFHLSGGTYRYFDTTLNVHGVLEPHEGVYQTHLYGQVTQQMLRTEARSPNPFFAWISFTAPHGGGPHEQDDPAPFPLKGDRVQEYVNPARPPNVKGRFDQRITRIPGGDDPRDDITEKPVFIRSRTPMTPLEDEAVLENYRQRTEALSVVDDEVANVMETLRRTGELDNTYVLFTSDNGYLLGEHRMRQGKILPYDPSLRVPLVMRGPGIPRGEERADPFLMLDFAPTILEAAGARTPSSLDGVSMLGVARDGDRGWTRGILTETGPRVIKSDVEESDNFFVRGNKPVALRFSVGVRTGRYLYVEHVSKERELYDLRTDPQQFDNVVDEPRMARVARLLARELDRLRDCVGAECRVPLPPVLRTSNPVPAYVAPLADRRPSRSPRP